MLLFLFFAFIAGFAMFSFAKNRLKTPLIANLLGSFCVWACLFSLGGVLGGSGPWSPGIGEPPDLSPYKYALKYLALALLAYGGAYALQCVFAEPTENR